MNSFFVLLSYLHWTCLDIKIWKVIINLNTLFLRIKHKCNFPRWPPFFKNWMLYFLDWGVFFNLVFQTMHRLMKNWFFLLQTNKCIVLFFKKCNFVTGVLLPVYKNYYSSQIWQKQNPVCFSCTILFKNKWQNNCKNSMQFII